MRARLPGPEILEAFGNRRLPKGYNTFGSGAVGRGRLGMWYFFLRACGEDVYRPAPLSWTPSPVLLHPAGGAHTTRPSKVSSSVGRLLPLSLAKSRFSNRLRLLGLFPRALRRTGSSPHSSCAPRRSPPRAHAPPHDGPALGPRPRPTAAGRERTAPGRGILALRAEWRPAAPPGDPVLPPGSSRTTGHSGVSMEWAPPGRAAHGRMSIRGATRLREQPELRSVTAGSVSPSL